VSEVKIENVSISMKLVDRKAIIAASDAAKANAEALKANADAIKAIAEMGRHHGPSYGIYVVAPEDNA